MPGMTVWPGVVEDLDGGSVGRGDLVLPADGANPGPLDEDSAVFDGRAAQAVNESARPDELEAGGSFSHFRRLA